MRIISMLVMMCALAALGCASTAPSPKPVAASVNAEKPLILERNEGERRIWRGYPGHPAPGAAFILKVDPRNGGSSHFVFGSEVLAPGDAIETHKHPSADEILLLETGTARVHLGNVLRVVHGGATVFIPAGTWVAVQNVGHDVVNLAFIFSSPGFEDFMRAESTRPGEKNTPVSKTQDDAILKRDANIVIYK